jgi:hypothetical protein
MTLRKQQRDTNKMLVNNGCPIKLCSVADQQQQPNKSYRLHDVAAANAAQPDKTRVTVHRSPPAPLGDVQGFQRGLIDSCCIINHELAQPQDIKLLQQEGQAGPHTVKVRM